jgi:glycerol dehydrogenase-like iron-containing ADH family enzyme
MNLLDTMRTPKQLPVSPATVVVGPGVRARLGEIARELGARALVITGPHAWRVIADELGANLDAAGVSWDLFTYDPDCTEPAAEAARALIRAKDAELVVGVGGGKALDLAKLVADAAGVPVANVPTSAATCAAWTALGNFYSEAGAFRFGRTFQTAPTAVVVDTELIARAPARLLASGLADTLAKWVETSASVDYDTADMTTRAAWRMAKFLHDEIRDWGVAAYRDAKAGRHTPLVDRAIEANICLAGTVGGLGGERCRSVAAHAVHNALTGQPAFAKSWHGEKVAFGILTQLILEERPADAESMARFFIGLDVPVTLEGLGYRLTDAQLDEVAAHVCGPHSTAHHLSRPVTPETVKAAMITADRLGRSLLSP